MAVSGRIVSGFVQLESCGCRWEKNEVEGPRSQKERCEGSLKTKVESSGVLLGTMDKHRLVSYQTHDNNNRTDRQQRLTSSLSLNDAAATARKKNKQQILSIVQVVPSMDYND